MKSNFSWQQFGAVIYPHVLSVHRLGLLVLPFGVFAGLSRILPDRFLLIWIVGGPVALMYGMLLWMSYRPSHRSGITVLKAIFVPMLILGWTIASHKHWGHFISVWGLLEMGASFGVWGILLVVSRRIRTHRWLGGLLLVCAGVLFMICLWGWLLEFELRPGQIWLIAAIIMAGIQYGSFLMTGGLPLIARMNAPIMNRKTLPDLDDSLQLWPSGGWFTQSDGIPALAYLAIWLGLIPAIHALINLLGG
ncbi:hypothetical protein [Pontibacter sp. G13]|uniref:hypothetical protein n=1 Tax=Pontibacter sp. G13 TaxID=3074898 RepID=UPI00288A533C|nr:hypothetical protein [Pontibacter sp. G13]WNJ18721.1 hypothetical protein RJD25_28020 [Pontibacter sp. G13]